MRLTLLLCSTAVLTAAQNGTYPLTNSTSVLATASSVLSSSSTTASSELVGDLIASGIGLSSTTNEATTRPATQRANVTTTSNALNGTTTSPGLVTSYTGDCWNEWNIYWNASYIIENNSTYKTSLVPVSNSYPESYTITTVPQTSTATRTVTESAGTYAISTFITTDTTSWTGGSVIGDIQWSWTTWTSTQLSEVPQYPDATITPPPCALPSIVPQCESSWEWWAQHVEFTNTDFQYPACTNFGSSGACFQSWSSYGNMVNTWYTSSLEAGPQPLCTAASITGSLCSGLQNSYLFEAYRNTPIYIDGPLGAVYTTVTAANGSAYGTHLWPSKSVLAPGCNAGCGRCRINGGNVQLFFWPPTTANGTITPAAGNASALVTATGHDFTFTSPTVYISFDSLYASDSCSAFGKTLTSTIVAITNTDHLSSLYGYQVDNGRQLTASLNLTDLYSTPVPWSIYMRQPRCASSLTLSEVTCARDRPYEPLVSIPDEVRQLDPKWATCTGSIDGVYDPPKALQPVAVAATVTTPGSGEQGTTAAQPASSPTSPDISTTADVPAPTAPPGVSATPTSQPEAEPATPSAEISPPLTTDPTPQASEANGSPTAEPAEQSGDSSMTDEADPGQSVVNTSVPSDGSSAGGAGQNPEQSTPASPAQTGAGSDGQASSATGNAGQSGNDDSPIAESSAGNGGSVPTQPPPAATSNALGVLQQAASAFTESSDAAASVESAQPGSATNAIGGVLNGNAGQPAPSSGVGFGGPQTTDPVADSGSGAGSPAIFTASGRTYTAEQQSGGAVVVAGAGTSVTLSAGAVATLDGVALSADSSDVIAVGDSSTVQLGDPGVSHVASAGIPLSTFIEQGSTYTVLAQASSDLLVAADGQTFTLDPGSTTVLGTETIAAAGGGAAVIEGETISPTSRPSGTVQLADPGTSARATAEMPLSTFVEQGTTYTILAHASSDVLVVENGHTIALEAGRSTIIGTRTIGEAGDGAAAVINGQTVFPTITAGSNTSITGLAITPSAPSGSDSPTLSGGIEFDAAGRTLWLWAVTAWTIVALYL